jgi:hypothetical protein
MNIDSDKGSTFFGKNNRPPRLSFGSRLFLCLFLLKIEGDDSILKMGGNDGIFQPSHDAGLMDDGAGLLDDAVGLLDDGVGLLDDGVGLLDDGAGLMDDGVGLLDDAVGLLDGGVGRLDGGVVCAFPRSGKKRTNQELSILLSNY